MDGVYSRLALWAGGGVAVRPRRSLFERTGSGAEAAAAVREGVGHGADKGRMTGALLWDSAVVLASYLAASRPAAAARAQSRPISGELAAGWRGACVEVGAGLALPGLTAAALGWTTTLTDRQECLPLLAAGAADNSLGEAVAVAPLAWGDPAAASALGTFDLVLASDCVYEVDDRL